MSNLFKYTKRVLTSVLAAAVVLTAIPSTAFGAEIDEDLAIEVQEAEVAEAGEEVVVENEDALTTDGASGDEEIIIEEGEGDPDQSYADTTVKFKDTTSITNAKMFTLSGDNITDLALGADADKDMNSDLGFTFYVAPLAGYELAANPLTLTGSYKATAESDAVAFSASDLVISDMTADEKSLASDTYYSVPGKLDAAKIYWAEGKKVTIKGGEGSFLANYLAATSTKVAPTIALSASSASAITYDVPIYKYDPSAEEADRFSNAILRKVRVTYNTAVTDTSIDFYGALSASDWAGYTPSLSLVKKNDKGNKVLDGTTLAFTDRATASFDPAENNYHVNSATGHKYLTVNATAAKNAYIAVQNHTDDSEEVALILTKDASAATYTITAETTPFVEFYKDASNPYDGGTRDKDTTTVIEDAKAADTFSAVASPDAQSGRTLTKLSYTIGDDDPVEAAFVSNKVTIPAKAGNVVVTGITTETVKFTEVGYATANKISIALKDGNKTALDPAMTTNQASRTTTVLSNGSLSFTVNPVAQYDLDGVTYTMYNTKGDETVITNRTLTPVNGVYTIPNIIGYVEVSVKTKALSDTIGVKTAADYSGEADVVDVRTGKAIDTTEKQYAANGETYAFTVTPKAGFMLAPTDAVTAAVGEEAVAVTAGANGRYSFTAPSAGPVVITVKTTKMMDVYKVANTYASITVNGSSLADDAKVQLASNGKITITATGLKGAEVTGVYYDATGTATSAPGQSATKKEDGSYEITASAVSTWRSSHAGLYVYVTTKRDAVAGSDFVAEFTDLNTTEGVYHDVTSGIKLYAHDINTTNDKTITAKFYKKDADKTAIAAASKYELALSGEDAIATVAGTPGVITTENDYKGGTAASTTDTLTATYSDAAFPNTLNYTATAPLSVLPLRDYYKKTNKSIAAVIKTNATKDAEGVAEDEIRNGSTDTETLQIAYYGTDANPTAVTPKTVAGDTEISKIAWTVNPPLSPEAIATEYKLNGARKNTDDADEAEISAPKKVQNLTVTGKVTFVDKTEAEVTKVVKVVENNYGYFALPTTVVNGVTTVNNGGNGAQTINLETAGSINSASLNYTVYQIIDPSKTGYLTNATALSSAGDIKAAIDADEIIPVSEVEGATVSDWSLTCADTSVTISGSNGAYTLTAASRNTTPADLTLTAKVGSYSVKTPTAEKVSVANKIARKTVKVITADGAGGTNYENPVFTAAYLQSLGYTAEEHKTAGVVDYYMLTDVEEGAELTLPAVSAFDATKINPKRSLAGWKITHSTDSYEKADGTAKTNKIDGTATEVKAIWAPKYSGVKAIDASLETATAIANNTVMAVGTEIPVGIGVYAIDTSTAPTSDTADNYSATLTAIPAAELANVVVTSTDAEAEKFTTTKSGSTYTFTNHKLTAGAEPTTANVKFTATWKEGGSDEAVWTATEVTGLSIGNAEEWEFAMADVELEVGQTKELSFDTFKLNTVAKNLGNKAAIFKNGAYTFESNNKNIATAAVSAEGSNTIAFKGTGIGTTKATFSFTDVKGTPHSYEVNIKVKAASYSIVAKLTQNHGAGALVAPSEITLAENATAFLPIGTASDLKVSLDKESEFVGTVSFTAVAVAPTTDNADVTVGGTTPDFTVNPAEIGTSSIKVTMTLTPAGGTASYYERVIPVESYGLVKVYGPDSSNTIYGSVTDDKAFAVYSNLAKTAEVTKDKYAVITVPYAKDATSYSVDGLKTFTAAWTDKVKAEEFLGWGITNAKIDSTAADTDLKALSGVALTIAKANVKTGASLYAYFKKAGITINGGYNNEIDLSDEVIGGADATDRGTLTVKVAPPKADGQILLYANKTAIIDFANTEAALDFAGWDGTTKLTVNKGTEGATFREDKFAVGKATGKVGVVELYIEANGERADTITVYANGEYSDDGKTYYMYRGENQKNFSATVGGATHYYDKDGVLVEDKAFKLDDGKWILLGAGGAQITTKGVNALTVGTTTTYYYVDENGNLLTGLFNGIMTTGVNKDSDKTYFADPETAALTVSDLATDGNKTYYFNGDGHMVKASASANLFEQTTDKKYYVNAEGQVAIADIFKVDGKDRLFREDGTIVKHTDADVIGGKISVPKIGGTVYVIEDDDTAKPDHTDHKWSVDTSVGENGWTWTKTGSAYTAATLTFKCSVGGETGTSDATITSQTKGKDSLTVTRYTATVTADPTGNVFSAKDYKYVKADGSEATKADWNKVAGGDDSTESEPEQSDVASYQSFNLFYNDVEIPVPGLQAALSNEGAKMSGKWTSFFTVADGSDTVTVSSSADAKKAVNNSLVVVDYTGGQFAYQLPVFYQKPSLKLSSTSGTIKKGTATTLTTTVQEKKSTGVYEAFEPDSVTYAGSATVESWTDGVITITAKAKTSGKFTVKKENWREALTTSSYSVKESTKDVIEGPKEVIVNTNSEKTDYEFTITKNGQELDSSNSVTVELPPKWSDAGIEGISAGTLEDGDIKLSLVGDATHKKGTYNLTFKSGNAKLNVKVKVVDKALSQAIKLDVKTKMNLLTGQKMVVVPTVKDLNGSVEDAEIKLTGAPFTAEYVQEKNQIIVSGNSSVTAGKHDTTITVTVNGEDIDVPLNFTVEAKKPTVKLATVTLPKTKVKSSDGADGATNVLSTYKQGWKTFGVKPTKVVLMNGKTPAVQSKDHSGWYEVDSKTGLLAQYNEDEGTILVHAQNSDGKGGTVKAEFYFNGQSKPITKSFTVKTK